MDKQNVNNRNVYVTLHRALMADKLIIKSRRDNARQVKITRFNRQ